MSHTARKRSIQFTREQWLKEALDALATEGARVLSVESICHRLGVSRGSFYWHFKDKDDFIQSVIKYWEQNKTLEVGKAVDSVGGKPIDRLLLLMEKIAEVHALGAYEVAVRAWASHEPRAAAVVRRVDRYRYRFVKSLFSELGFKDDELEMRTRTFFVALSFDASFSFKESKKQQQKRLKLLHQFFTRQ